MTREGIDKLNRDFCKALGLDPGTIEKIVIVIDPDTGPRFYFKGYVSQEQMFSLVDTVCTALHCNGPDPDVPQIIGGQ